MTDSVADKERCTSSFRRPSVLVPDALGQYHVRIACNSVSVHEWFDEQGLQTPAWTFDGEIPGKLIEVRQGHQTRVLYENHIPSDEPMPFESHFDADSSAPEKADRRAHHGAWITSGLRPEFVVHLHGAIVEPTYDGNPGLTSPTAFGDIYDCVYGNAQRPMLLWYHDHGMPQTSRTADQRAEALQVRIEEPLIRQARIDGRQLGAEGTGGRRQQLVPQRVLGIPQPQHSQLLRLIWVKGQLEDRALYERWNSFSRIRIDGDPNTPRTPVAWGMSSATPPGMKARQLDLTIDAGAGTTLTAPDGGLNSLQYLRYDVTNLPYYIRHDAKVFVIGAGGGRDVLSALLFGEKSVVAVEINGATVDAVNGRFGDFTGHLDRDSSVTFVTDEARSYIARQRARFDIIQASFTTTWSATSAGAFVLSENSIYTVEAWKLFLDRLSDHGVMSFSRWYLRDNPTEMYRLTSLASASLQLDGVRDPRSHIIIVKNVRTLERASVPEVGTMLVSKQPFSDQDIGTIEQIARSMNFDVVLSPRASVDRNFAALASGKDLEAFAAAFPLNIASATDNNPFFFHLLRIRDIFKGRSVEPQGRGHIHCQPCRPRVHPDCFANDRHRAHVRMHHRSADVDDEEGHAERRWTALHIFCEHWVRVHVR